MYGAVFKIALLVPIAVLLAVFVERIMGEQLAIMAMAPGGTDTAVYGYTAAVANNLLLFLMLGLLVLLIAVALVERQVGGIR